MEQVLRAEAAAHQINESMCQRAARVESLHPQIPLHKLHTHRHHFQTNTCIEFECGE